MMSWQEVSARLSRLDWQVDNIGYSTKRTARSETKDIYAIEEELFV